MGALMAGEPLRAGVEDLLPLVLFVVLWWVSSRREKKRRLEQEKAPEAAAAARSGQPLPPAAGERVDPLQLIQQMLFGGMELPPLPLEPPATPPPIADAPAALGGENERRSKPPIRPAAPLPEWVREPRPALKPVATAPPPPGPGSRPRPRASRRELQQAIVWSEILAPPVSLRDEPPQQ